jgi:hypothetical protein
VTDFCCFFFGSKKSIDGQMERMRILEQHQSSNATIEIMIDCPLHGREN